MTAEADSVEVRLRTTIKQTLQCQLKPQRQESYDAFKAYGAEVLKSVGYEFFRFVVLLRPYPAPLLITS